MAASQSRMIHPKTHRVCPIQTRNIWPIGPISSTILSPWVGSLPKGRSHMPCMIQRATVPEVAASQSCSEHFKTHRVCPIHTKNIGPIGPLSSTILAPWIESLPKADPICHAWFKELLYQENGCVPITYGTFQDPQGLSYPHKKYWTHRSNIQYHTITLNRVLTQRQVSYAMHDS